MGNKQKNGHLFHTLLAMSILPLVIVGFIITFFSYYTFTKAIYTEVESGLKNTAETVATLYDFLYPGDYKLTGTTAYDLIKGEKVLTGDYTVIDAVKEDTGIDITLFYYDTRILTTLLNESGERIVGTGAVQRVLHDVLEGNEAHFYTNAAINGQQYFAYYTPLHNADGSIVGMLYAGKPHETVARTVRRAVLPIFIIAITAVMIISIFSYVYTDKLIGALKHIRQFLSQVSNSNLSAEMSRHVLCRNDELSDMARSAMYMQRSLRTLVEEDTLTSLHNRRFGDKKLREIYEASLRNHSPFVLAIGDIDFFKKFNDTYGHDCGDIVLQQVSACLKKCMAGKGFAARWGGEEFLLVFENMELQTGIENLNALLHEISHNEVLYKGQKMNVTMTIGIVEGGSYTNMKQLMRDADEKLYYGKMNGRNCVIS